MRDTRGRRTAGRAANGAAVSSEGIEPTHTVLLVDHNRNVRDLCKRELEREGYRVILAEDGRKALTILKQTPPDVLVTETSDLEARKAVEWVLVHLTDLPVIVHTADRCCLAEFHDWPVEACVEKSCDLTDLKETIGRALT
jgi:DNA-binding NtrC family response regulator